MISFTIPLLTFTIQNVAWPNFYRSLVNRICDSKALYVINIRMKKIYKIKINTAISKKRSCFFRQKTNTIHINRTLY